MARHINSLSDQTLADLKRELQQLRNDTSNLRRHLAHVGARHREAVWVAGGTDVVAYEEGYLVKPAGYTDAASEFPDSGGSSYRAGIAYGDVIGSESTVGITHDNTVLYPYINGNFTATKAGVYLCLLTIRCEYNFAYTAADGVCAPYQVLPFRKYDATSAESIAASIEWFVMWNSDFPSWCPEFTSHSMSYIIPLRVGDKMGVRCRGVAGYPTGSYYLRAELSKSTLQVTRISDTYENLFEWT